MTDVAECLLTESIFILGDMGDVIIKNMDMPSNCAKCPCVVVWGGEARCSTPTGLDKRICPDSLYFDGFRPKWCPMEVRDGNDK